MVSKIMICEGLSISFKKLDFGTSNVSEESYGINICSAQPQNTETTIGYQIRWNMTNDRKSYLQNKEISYIILHNYILYILKQVKCNVHYRKEQAF